jgi:hypothetical protein
LISPAKTGDFDKVTILAKQYRAKFNEIKGN